MKRITIDHKEYTIEYSIEASLYDECTISFMDVFVRAGMSENYAMNGDARSAMDEVLSTMANFPNRVVTLFYAGLMEHHGENGDRSINSRDDAKNLLKKYIHESKKTYVDINNELMNIIAEDNFFDLIGLNEMIPSMTEENSPETEKKPRKKKAGATTSEK